MTWSAPRKSAPASKTSTSTSRTATRSNGPPGGLLVWRKADNFTAFTDGGTTWVNGPNGLQSRPNGERFSWENDPVDDGAVVGESSAFVAVLASWRVDWFRRHCERPGSGAAPEVRSAVPTPTNTPTSGTQASVAVTTPTPTATLARTATPTQNAVEAKFSTKPDKADTGNDARVIVRTNARKGTCALLVKYHNTDEANYGGVEIDDGRCEWKWTIPSNTRTGEAKMKVIVTGESGTVTIEDEFDVRKGDESYAGSVDVEMEIKEFPDDANFGDEVEFAIETGYRKKGTCTIVVTWPKIGAQGGESKTPDDRGRCSWKMTVPTMIPKKGTASVVIAVTKDNAARSVTKEFEVSPK